MGHYEDLFSRTADLMCELDGSGHVLRGNEALECFARRKAAGRHLTQLFDERDLPTLQEALEALGAGASTRVVEARMRRRSQRDEEGPELAWTSWQLTRLDGDGIVGVGRDVTSARETAQELQAKSSFLHSIIEAEPECVKLVTARGELLDMNAAGLRMVGASSRESAIGLNVYDLVAEEDRDRFIGFNDRVCAGEGGELSFDIIGLDGTRRSMETIAVPLPREPGGELLHLAITRDVTQRLQLERQVRHAQRMESVGQLAGGIAHDFNNLLTAIIGPVELLLDELPSDHPHAADLGQVKQTAERAARLTHQLLAFARRQVVQPKPVALTELVGSMEDMLRRIIGEAYRLELDSSPSPCTVFADRGQLEQVLVNLVVNARDAAGEGGHIRVAVGQEQVRTGRARRLGCEPGAYVTLTVADDGAGIASEHLPHVFDPFFTTKPTGEGTGLGLATCYGIVTQAGGAITVESDVDRGATFTVLLPSSLEARQEARPEGGRERAAQPARGGGDLVGGGRGRRAWYGRADARDARVPRAPGFGCGVGPRAGGRPRRAASGPDGHEDARHGRPRPDQAPAAAPAGLAARVHDRVLADDRPGL